MGTEEADGAGAPASVDPSRAPVGDGRTDGSSTQQGSRFGRRLGRWLDAVIALVLVVLVAAGALRWVDSTAYVVVVLQTTGPLVVVGLMLLTVATLLLRRWRMLLPVGVALAVAATVAAPAFEATTTPKADHDLTVMTANVWIGSANADQLMEAVRYHSVDVLVLTEATPAMLRRLDEAGASDYFTRREGVARAGTFSGTIVLSRFPVSVRDLGADPARQHTPSVQPELDVTTPRGKVRLKVAHPTAPVQGDTGEWRAGLRALQAWVQGAGTGEPVVMAGDFNACFGHPGFRDLADGLVDAQRADGEGWVRTWPFAGQRVPAYVQLDHLLSRGLTVVDAGQVAYNHADHAAVWASYTLQTR